MKRTTRIASLLSGAALAFGLLATAVPAAHADGDHEDGQRGGSHSRVSADTQDWPQGKSTSDPDGDSNGGWDKPGFHGGLVDADHDGNNGCGNDIDREDDNNGHCGRQAGGAEVRGDTDHAAACPAEAGDDDDADSDDADDNGNHGAEVKSVATSHDGDDHGATVSAVAKAHDSAHAAEADDADSDDTDGAGCPGTENGASAAGTTTRLETAARVSAAAAPATSVLGAVEVAPAETSTTPTPAPGTQVLGITETAPSTLARTGAGVGALALAGGLCLGGGRLTALIRRRLGL